MNGGLKSSGGWSPRSKEHAERVGWRVEKKIPTSRLERLTSSFRKCSIEDLQILVTRSTTELSGT